MKARALLEGIALGTLPALVLGVAVYAAVPSESSVRVRAVTAQPSGLRSSEPARWTPTAGPVSVPPVVVAEAPPSPPLPPIQLRVVEPEPIPVTVGELYQALARSPWPRALWPEVVRIARCESRWGAGVDMAAEGDGGRALGVLQIRVDAHPDLARNYELMTLDGALAAAWLVYARAGSSWEPWACA